MLTKWPTAGYYVLIQYSTGRSHFIAGFGSNFKTERSLKTYIVCLFVIFQSMFIDQNLQH